MDNTLFLVLVAAGAAAYAAFAAHQARVAALPDVGRLVKESVEVRAEVSALRAEWLQYLKALDAAIEALEDQSSTVQRHRARVEQANRRAQDHAPPEEADPMSAALARARAQGLPV
jgi:Skp family chaperone for outer membrane proteins